VLANGGGGQNVGGELVLVLGNGAEVPIHLNSVPELRGLREKRSEADRHGRRDGAAGMDDLVDSAWCDTDRASHGVLRNSHGNQVFLQ